MCTVVIRHPHIVVAKCFSNAKGLCAFLFVAESANGTRVIVFGNRITGSILCKIKHGICIFYPSVLDKRGAVFGVGVTAFAGVNGISILTASGLRFGGGINVRMIAGVAVYKGIIRIFADFTTKTGLVINCRLGLSGGRLQCGIFCNFLVKSVTESITGYKCIACTDGSTSTGLVVNRCFCAVCSRFQRFILDKFLTEVMRKSRARNECVFFTCANLTARTRLVVNSRTCARSRRLQSFGVFNPERVAVWQCFT